MWGQHDANLTDAVCSVRTLPWLHQVMIGYQLLTLTDQISVKYMWRPWKGHTYVRMSEVIWKCELVEDSIFVDLAKKKKIYIKGGHVKGSQQNRF